MDTMLCTVAAMVCVAGATATPRTATVALRGMTLQKYGSGLRRGQRILIGDKNLLHKGLRKPHCSSEGVSEIERLPKAASPSALRSSSVRAIGEKGERDMGFWLWRAAILGMTILWGSNFAVIRAVESTGGVEVPSSVFASIRFVMATLSLLPFMSGGSPSAIGNGFGVGLLVALGYIGQAIGLETTTAEKAAFICALQVVFVIFFTALKKRSIDLQGSAAAALGIAGVALLELTGQSGVSVGDLWCLAMPASFGLSYVLVGDMAKGFSGNDEVAFTGSQCAGFAAGSLVWLLAEQAHAGHLGSLIASVATHNFGHLQTLLGMDGVDTGFWIAAAYTGVITTAASIVLQTYAFKKVPPTDASIIIVSEPLWAALFAAVLLGESLGVKDFYGGSLIAAACLVNALDSRTFEGMLAKVNLSSSGEVKPGENE